MDVNEIVAEMHRKPDPEYLLQWIDEQIKGTTDPTLTAIATAIDHYYVALEEN